MSDFHVIPGAVIKDILDRQSHTMVARIEQRWPEKRKSMRRSSLCVSTVIMLIVDASRTIATKQRCAMRGKEMVSERGARRKMTTATRLNAKMARRTMNHESRMHK